LIVALSFFVAGLDRFDHWFEHEPGDPIIGYQIGEGRLERRG